MMDHDLEATEKIHSEEDAMGGQEVSSSPQPSKPKSNPHVQRISSSDIRDPHVAIHGLDNKLSDSEEDDDLKAQGQAEQDEEEDPLPMLTQMKSFVWKMIKIGAVLLTIIYLLAAFIIDFDRATAVFVITVLVAAYNLYAFWAQRNEDVMDKAEDAIIQFLKKTDTNYNYGVFYSTTLIVIMLIIMAVTVKEGRNLLSLFGMMVFLALTWLFSWKPANVAFRPVLGAIFMQFIFGYIVIRTSWGLGAMEFLSDVFTTLLGYTTAGSSFVFGWLTDGSLFGRPFQLAPDADGNDMGSYFLAPPLFFNVLPTVIFFSALMSVGYYIRVLPWAVRKLGYVLGLLLGTSAAESLSAAGNIFVGQTEAPLLVKPFMPDMTESELHAIMTGGFATIAGSVFGLYISFGIDGVAMLAASIMSAPAALAISKIAYPETEESPTATGKKGAYTIPPSGDQNVVHAAASGAIIGTQLMLNIAGNLIAFLAIIEMLDQLIIYLGERVDIEISFSIICEILFFPVAWLMGVDADDCRDIAYVLGLKIFANEFVAYGVMTEPNFRANISDRSFYIASYALCGFSNFGSIGIQLGGLTPLAPKRAGSLAKLVVSAMIAGNTACLITACIAGIFYEGN